MVGLVAAMRSFLPERVHQLKEKHRRRKGLSYKEIKFLKKELRSMRAALRMVGDMAPEELDDTVKIWAKDLRQLCYDTEDILDTYLVRVECLQPVADQHRHSSSGFVKKLTSGFNKDETCHRIAEAARDVKSACEEFFVRSTRYGIPLSYPALTRVDPRLINLHRENEDLTGIEEAMEELTRRLTDVDVVSNQQLKIMSLVGLAGVGKTTLAMVLYRKLKSQFDSKAFVAVSPNPDMKNFFRSILMHLGFDNKQKLHSWDQTKLIEEIKKILQDRRYLIVLDDIWDKEVWLTIKPAMVDNNHGSIIITTTRKFDVAEEIGGVNRVKPLSYQSSRSLFCRRIFGTHECPNNEMAEMSENILRKCGGVPLAILDICGLLASTPSEQWHEVCNNIMKAASATSYLLLLSYYNLPSHMRNCILYLSIFPEGCVVRSDQLVWLWIAEGFVQEKQGSSLFEVGQSYFDKLINSGMMQEVQSNAGYGMVKHCTVPNIFLALILYLTTEENFATILDDRQQQDYSRVKIRRLSLQNHTSLEHATAEATPTVPHVRSVIAFGDGIDAMPPLSSFYILRVLELEGCELQGKCELKHIGDLLQLRYLGLRGTDVAQLPKEIGNLQFLQILDLKGTSVKELPSTVALLRRLLCLYVEQTTRLPKGMGNLTSLEELSKISLSESPNSLKELASLVELRVLDIALRQDVIESSQSRKDVLEFLSIVQKMQYLRVYGCSDLDFMSKEGWAPPPALRRFVAVDGWFSELPTWISDAEGLSELQIGVKELWREGMQSLGRLRELRFLCLSVERMGERLAVDADAFPKLKQLRFSAHTCLVFCRGAMPKVEVVELVLEVDKADGEFNWGLSNLRSLEKVIVKLRTGNSASANEEAEAALRHAVESHPNRRIKLEITTVTSQNKQMESVDDRAGNVASSSEIQEERYAL